MKRIKILPFIAAAILFSCEKSDELTNEKSDSLTKEILELENSYSKIETNFSEGTIKNEHILLSKDLKNETTADERTMMLISDKLEEDFSKETVVQSSTSMVGVFKNGSCGSFTELRYYMDCEDSSNNSKQYGFTGDSKIVSKGNVTLEFCMVPEVYVSSMQVSGVYGLLNVTNVPSYLEKINRYFDNEDSGNTNQMRLDGLVYPSGYRVGECVQTKNTLLSFSRRSGSGYAGVMSTNNIGIGYGVLGSLPNFNTGRIHMDDEDSSNRNYCKKIVNGESTNLYGNVDDLMVVGRNTDLMISMIR